MRKVNDSFVFKFTQNVVEKIEGRGIEGERVWEELEVRGLQERERGGGEWGGQARREDCRNGRGGGGWERVGNENERGGGVETMRLGKKMSKKKEGK